MLFWAYGALNVGFERQRLKGMQGRGRLAGVLQWGKRVGEVERNVGRERAQSPSEGLLVGHPKESVMRISTGDCACGTGVSYRGERVWVDNCFSSEDSTYSAEWPRPNGGATNSRRVLIIRRLEERLLLRRHRPTL